MVETGGHFQKKDTDKLPKGDNIIHGDMWRHASAPGGVELAVEGEEGVGSGLAAWPLTCPQLGPQPGWGLSGTTSIVRLCHV